MDCDASSLLSDSRCFKCIPRGLQRAVAIYLLCQWAQKKSPSPPVVPFSWAPASSLLRWTDKNGTQQADLATFQATADIATVVQINNFLGVYVIDSISGLSALPALTTVKINPTTTHLLAPVSVAGCLNLTYVDFSRDQLTSSNINQILFDLDSIGNHNGTALLKQKVATLYDAPPTVGPPNGIVAKANLIAKGWTVTTDV